MWIEAARRPETLWLYIKPLWFLSQKKKKKKRFSGGGWGWFCLKNSRENQVRGPEWKPLSCGWKCAERGPKSGGSAAQLGVLGGGRSRGARGNPSSRQLPILSRIQAQEGSPTLSLKCMCPVHMPVHAFPGRRSESQRPETHIRRGPSRYSYYPRNSNNW